MQWASFGFVKKFAGLQKLRCQWQMSGPLAYGKVARAFPRARKCDAVEPHSSSAQRDDTTTPTTHQDPPSNSLTMVRACRPPPMHCNCTTCPCSDFRARGAAKFRKHSWLTSPLFF